MNKSDSDTRRVRMTKRLMMDALMELMTQQPMASISVTQLCARADVNRSTFYSYYSDIMELLRDIEDNLIRQLPSTTGKENALTTKAGQKNTQDGASAIHTGQHLQTPSGTDPSLLWDQQLLEDFAVFFGYVRKHSKDFHVLLQNGNPDFSERLLKAAMQHFPKPDIGEGDAFLKRWGYIYTLNGVIGLLRDWIQGDFPIDDRAFAKIVLQMSSSAYLAVTGEQSS